ncbi:MAG TPA: hypothetical protein VGB49_09360 [Caulobacteraceae bacterium]|jgi:hypothetical protein
MDRQLVAQGVADRLMAAEAAVDRALILTAELAAALPTARLAAGLSAVAGQAAFDHAAGAVGSLTDARRSVVEMHNALAALQRRVGGLGPLALGPLDKPADDVPRLPDGVRPMDRVSRAG